MNNPTDTERRSHTIKVLETRILEIETRPRGVGRTGQSRQEELAEAKAALAALLSVDSHLTLTRDERQPLLPEPKFEHYVGSGWQVNGSGINTPPAGYTAGFEDGAYALAKQAMQLLRSHDMETLVRVLGEYERGVAFPTANWSHERPRN